MHISIVWANIIKYAYFILNLIFCIRDTCVTYMYKILWENFTKKVKDDHMLIISV